MANSDEIRDLLNELSSDSDSVTDESDLNIFCNISDSDDAEYVISSESEQNDDFNWNCFRKTKEQYKYHT